VVRRVRRTRLSSWLDELLPAHDFAEVHRREVSATPQAVLSAVKDVTPEETPLLRLLFALRSGPAFVAGRRGLPRAKGRSLYAQLVDYGFLSLVEEEDELVLAYVGQPWRLSGGARPALGSAAEWVELDAPGYVKGAMSFRVEALEGERVLLTTETRVRATDPRSRRRFARYWRAIRPGSGAIRRSWLHAAARRAEADC
jgi:hypothetical protein